VAGERLYKISSFMTPINIQQSLALALQHHKSGRLREAEDLYRRILIQQPAHFDAKHLLGVIAQQTHRVDLAIDLLRQAIAIRPDFPQAHSNLGNTLKDKGRIDEAIAEFQTAIALNPKLFEAHNNLGNALRDKGQFDESIAACRQAIALKPDFAEAHSNLGNALRAKGMLDEAVAAYRQAIAFDPQGAPSHNNLGIALRSQGQLDDAIAAFNRAIALKPDYAAAFNNLGNALKDAGKLDDALAAFRQAMALRPGYAEAHSNLILALQYHPAYDARTIAEEHQRWSLQHAQPLRQFIQPPENERDPDRALRVGFVSPDFRHHAVGRFLLPLFRHHDHAACRIICYSDVSDPDDMTEMLRRYADDWHNIVGRPDERVAHDIRENRIDILVDLAAHTAGNRLRVFARKPAPVQVTYLAYCSSTGLETIDYRLSDPHLDPISGQSFYSEKTVLLPDTYWCYEPIVESADPGFSPALARGTITFGCLNNFCKASPESLNLWMQLLATIPDSRLILYAPEGVHRDAVRNMLKSHSVGEQRLTFVGKVPLSDYFKLYQQVDIALDPFPFNGGTTTCDALWMGVPVVTLKGRTAVGRGGASILANIGAPEYIAQTPDQYVQIALALAADVPRLAELRRTLRGRMQASPLMDAPKFARNIEAAYRRMWHTWCKSDSSRSQLI
jgi:protein O-GlcNAc transferase